jgi:hypothetical protein
VLICDSILHEIFIEREATRKRAYRKKRKGLVEQKRQQNIHMRKEKRKKKKEKKEEARY